MRADNLHGISHWSMKSPMNQPIATSGASVLHVQASHRKKTKKQMGQ